MSFSNIRYDIESAISGTNSEINRCREFWLDEGGTLYVENVLNSILNQQKSMKEQAEQAESRKNGNDQQRAVIESHITAAQTRDSSQDAVNEQLRTECETLIEECRSTLSAAEQLSNNEYWSLFRNLSDLESKINGIMI